ncbi:MAG TPA: DUF2147 domain-containing protein [Acinetobacter sp.]|nr:DUF2147 domain-containing protein [Acinetobacter sp.]HQW52937.1 DUF2147 domain-containing protein [Acinetobacter sp.]HQZ58289.1 DUF2147 domain-containing protein [Acinetobacter sp.]HRA92162.1 DUF2147 domain-containing protein [Acinetobacter sp.]
MNTKIMALTFLLGFAPLTFAQDITGVWQSVDDVTGAPKAQIEISQKTNGTYEGRIIKITPRAGYTPKEFCAGCPAPYTNKPILGLSIIHNLKHKKDFKYGDGKILDPLSGRIYSLSAKLSPNGNRLTLRGFVGVSLLGRTQIWLRAK